MIIFLDFDGSLARNFPRLTAEYNMLKEEEREREKELLSSVAGDAEPKWGPARENHPITFIF